MPLKFTIVVICGALDGGAVHIYRLFVISITYNHVGCIKFLLIIQALWYHLFDHCEMLGSPITIEMIWAILTKMAQIWQYHQKCLKIK